MVVMTPQATEAQIAAVVRRLEAAGVHAKVMPGELTTAIGAIGDPEGVRAMALEGMPGVDQVIPISRPYKLASSELSHYEPTRFEVDGHRVGGDTFCLIAGPCTVESRDQVMTTAHTVLEAGASLFRGGAYKPRTSPYAFQGMGVEGLKLLRAAGDEFNLATVSEVMEISQIEGMLPYVDILQVGARNMQNFNLLSALGQIRKPILLKRGMSATIQEWLLASEYILSGGNYDVILCERGIRTFETYTRNTLDISAIPVIDKLSHLPIIADPSHAVGRRDKVMPLARAIVAAGADGLLIEVHHDPEKAVCDGPQSLYPDQFTRLMDELRIIVPAVGRGL